MKGLRILFIIAALLSVSLQYGQESGEGELLSLDRGPITSQFEYVYKKSGNYRSDGKKYEVVRVISLDKLRQNVLDTLKVYSSFKSNIQYCAMGNHRDTLRNFVILYIQI